MARAGFRRATPASAGREQKHLVLRQCPVCEWESEVVEQDLECPLCHVPTERRMLGPVIPAATGDDKNPHAAALGRLGGLKGGRARAEVLTPARRRAIARKAARARWSKKG